MLAAKPYFQYFKRFLMGLTIVLCTAWQAMAWYLHQPLGHWGSIFAMALSMILSVGALVQRFKYGKSHLLGVFGLCFSISLGWFLSLSPQQNRHWQADVSKVLHYEKQGHVIHLHNVRNFDWRSPTDFTERWESRQYDLRRISGVNVITSYWMGPKIAHTLVSFDFEDQAPLVFSIEIRKEQHESFSAIGGFFRQYELSLIAADEKDIVYTRSNIRGEQVYFFPIQGLSQAHMQDLFMQYLKQSDQLRGQAAWYNTLFSNCTTLVYDMARQISPYPLPLDYRLLASGYLPNYLYDVQALDQKLTMQQWYAQAHANPKVVGRAWDANAYSDAIRQPSVSPSL